MFHILHLVYLPASKLQKHGRACELLLQHARADYDKSMIPGYRDLSELVSYRSEVYGDSCQPAKIMFEKEIQLRKCRGQFTGAEDNLLLRGVVSLFIISMLVIVFIYFIMFAGDKHDHQN